MAIVDGKIRCFRCGDWKPPTEFPPSSVKVGRGACRPCRRAIYGAHRAKNVSTYRAQAAAHQREYRRRMTAEKKEQRYAEYRAWLKAHPEKEFEYKCLRRFGLRFSDYERMLAEQGGGCACCGAKVNKSGRRLGVDHDHRSGKVRGILCHHCNAGIGHFDDDPERLKMAIAYLKRHRQTRRATMRINLIGGQDVAA